MLENSNTFGEVYMFLSVRYVNMLCFSVGAVGQSNLVRCGSDLQEAKDVFTKK